MKIFLEESFNNRLEAQIEFISINNPARARKFKKDLLSKIKTISKNPYKHRKSIYYSDESIRDWIFKGYIIVFRIKPDVIEVFGFIKYQNSLKDD